jgi:hypothetical protein
MLEAKHHFYTEFGSLHLKGLHQIFKNTTTHLMVTEDFPLVQIIQHVRSGPLYEYVDDFDLMFEPDVVYDEKKAAIFMLFVPVAMLCMVVWYYIFQALSSTAWKRLWRAFMKKIV